MLWVSENILILFLLRVVISDFPEPGNRSCKTGVFLLYINDEHYPHHLYVIRLSEVAIILTLLVYLLTEPC